MSGEILRIEVPLLAPSVNHCYRNVKWGGKVLTKEAKEFKQLIGFIVRTKRVVVRTDVRYRLTLELSSPQWFTKKGAIHMRAGDLDNFSKICCDALFDHLSPATDAQVFELRMVKITDKVEKTVFVLEEI